jgi:adenosylcobinamide-phosphate synthase
MNAVIASLALLVERRVGYPQPLVERIGHPVIWMGWLLSQIEQRVDHRERTRPQRRLAGVLTILILLAVVGVIALAIQIFLRSLPGGWLLEALVATSLLAQKELGRAVGAVAEALRHSLHAARDAVSHIVGRDPQQLDQAGIARAAIETLAESTSDGVIAPWFWLVLLGLPGIALYKAINTADSMIGHLNERYRDYGWAAARLDDLANLLPARLSALLIVIACFSVPGASPSGAWAAAMRDARKHRSPNSGWPEAAFAGALGFALGGPRSYDGEVIDLPIMGDGRPDLGSADIAAALSLYRATLNVLLAASTLVTLGLLLA